MAVAAVQHLGFPAPAQVVERLQVGIGQILDMDVVAHACAVGRGVVGAEDHQLFAPPHRHLAGDLDEQGGPGGGLADAAVHAGARYVEVAQGDVAQVGGGGEIAQHPFAHQLGGAVGVDGGRGALFVAEVALRDAIDRRGRGKDEVPHARVLAAGQQIAGVAGVVAIVFERVADRFRDHGVGGEVHDGVDAVVGQHPGHQGLVPRIAHHQFGALHRLPEAGGEVVQHHHLLACVHQLPHDVAADVAGAAADQNAALCHDCIPCRSNEVPNDSRPTVATRSGGGRSGSGRISG